MFGVAVLASVWSHYGSYASRPVVRRRDGAGVYFLHLVHYGSYASGQSFVDGMVPAVWIGAAVVASGAVAAFLIPKRARRQEAEELEPVFDPA